ncbi:MULTISPECIES: helix-turn-helix transcriptional regulator [unclassified Streptomyces]|uniref:helix-turn-helix domain-containing protein n=1 Tax=unclassified Streptomyces TaxID=2593676 RepID=UPI002366F924|nr:MULTISPECIES: helix-turn-helix transcriptional regulator [unclassified Streptomyces]MDF3142890.1 helix-turn-helix transcriptional regulator [Streptomyces sp. T21Q-yed]WDF39301.1 helix-turn-helix transcriptional regulator [Streptomyces sp. T12]
MGEVVDGERESGRAVLGRTLKFLREKAGKTLGQLADDTGYDKSYLSRLESGERLSKVTVMEDLDGYYGAGDLLVRHWNAARLDAFMDQFKRFMELEATARIMWMFTPGVPGLLQTEDFAREVLSGPQTTLEDDEWVEEQVAARIGRQYLLRQKPEPSVRIIVDETAFRRPAALPKTWEEQLLHIETVAMRSNVTLQVLPFAAGVHHHMDGSLTLLWQKDGSGVAYTEGNGCSRLIEEPDSVLRRRLSYDRLRDLALSPSDSLTFIRDVLEEHKS